jgi:tetratricopeptide (TPR) repeat protein
MKVPYQLRKATEAAPAAGLLLLSESVADLLALCAAAGAGRPGHPEAEAGALPPVHSVPGGFLVKRARPADRAFPGALRLRRLAPDLFLPADAELVPALLDEEAAGLVRQRGLVFLPGRVLAYDLTPLPASALLTAPRLPNRGWQPLPAPPPRPGRLREILLDLPEESPDAVLDSGGEAIGEEAPRPPAAGPGATAAGKAAAGAGRGLMWLGNALGWKGLAQAGAGLFAWAAALAPRLTEEILGRQEAALRELLRRFRAGDIEAALRRALPLGGSADRGGAPAGDARLPVHNPFYCLADLLGSRGGPAAWWLGGADLQRELAAEYRKAAQAAAARGDYRRAAFIYGKLLNDYRLAADVLSRGGLHHDAAVLYLEVLGDTLAAARAFEAAGEVDRALRLYRQRGDHVLAGDLLRRAGEEEAAVQEYRLAAAGLVAANNHVAAGELMLERARRPDLAVPYFAEGWTRRPAGSALGCLARLAPLYAEQETPGALLKLTDEAEEFFAPPGNETGAGQFFNALARLAERPNLAARRDDLRDRALAGLAGKLRQRAAEEMRPGAAVSRLLGQSGAWTPAVVSDADYAFKAALRRPQRPAAGDARVNGLRLGRGEVTAACAAAGGRLFVGFANGAVVLFDPADGAVHTLPAGDMPVWPVAALATDAGGRSLVALHARAGGDTRLAAYTDEGGVFTLRKWREAGPETAWLTPIARPHRPTLGAGDAAALTLLDFPTLVPGERIDGPRPEYGLSAAILLEDDPRARSWGKVRSELLFAGNEVCHFPYRSAGEPEGIDLRWAAGANCSQLRAAPPVSWLRTATGLIELAGLGGGGTAYWTKLVFGDGATRAVTYPSASGNYLAAALARPGLVAAVTAWRVEWLRNDGGRLVARRSTALSAATTLACFPSPPTGELLVVCRGGLVLRVPIPD